ncbi:MAG: T9SS type A sorting domain-containing protein [Candidatus Kapaibacterium sp.]
MKKFLILIMLVCGINAMAQENAASLPELQEWYSIKGRVSGLISYLPGFDSVGGGLNAIALKIGNSDRVFYNRFPFDTVSQFQWKVEGGEIVVQIDFNNDGIHDYLDYKGRLYTGTKKGEKPNPEPIGTLTTRIADRNFIHDFNNDSYPDVMIRNGAARVEILFGNKELSQIKRSIKPYPRTIGYIDYIDGYTNENGKPRLIFYAYEDYREGFYLYGIRTASKGDSVEIFLDELDKIEVQKERKNDPRKFDATGSSICLTRKEVLFELHYEDFKKTEIYTILNDKLSLSKTIDSRIILTNYLQGSIDGDDENDYVGAYNGTPFVFFNGLSDVGIKPVLRMPIRECGASYFRVVNDVNNDNINDLAYGGTDGCFSIYLGLDWRTVNINSVAEYNSFKLHQNIPNPVQKDRKTLLPVSLKQGGNYSIVLYSLQGSKIKDLFNGELSEGEHKIPLNLMGLSAGMYIVKMNNGSVSRERAIMIGE